MDTLSYAVGWIAVNTALLVSFGAVIVAVVEIEFSAAKRRRAARIARKQAVRQAAQRVVSIARGQRA